MPPFFYFDCRQTRKISIGKSWKLKRRKKKLKGRFIFLKGRFVAVIRPSVFQYVYRICLNGCKNGVKYPCSDFFVPLQSV